MVKVTKFVTPSVIIWCFPEIEYEFIVRKNKPLEISVFRMNGDYVDKIYLRDKEVAVEYMKRLDSGTFILAEVALDGI